MKAALLSLVLLCSAVASAAPRIRVRIDTSEAEAVLAILDKRADAHPIANADWARLFATEPYVLLKAREAHMKRPFTDAEFRAFVESPELLTRRAALRRTLDAWKSVDVVAAARRALLYLPAEARIHATIYPAIKPRGNSFVWELDSNPAIFMNLDPQVSAAKFENTLTHELHHVGDASDDAAFTAKLARLPEHRKLALRYLGAFFEGVAMLAAAGAPDVDPHAHSTPAERARWQSDFAKVPEDMKRLESFFLDVLSGRLTDPAEVRDRAMPFWGDAQGAWYTVGYAMAVAIEKHSGREALLRAVADPRLLIPEYNKAASELKLPLWSDELVRALSGETVSAGNR